MYSTTIKRIYNHVQMYTQEAHYKRSAYRQQSEYTTVYT